MKQVTDFTPPRWPLRLLRFFVKEKFVEEIEGDMEEIFHENVKQYSYARAKRMYTWEMLKLLRPALVKGTSGIIRGNQFSLFKNYYKIAGRNLLKYPLNSFINLFGLAVAIGICIFIYGFARYTYSTDQFHKNKNEVYLATFFAKRDGTVQEFGNSPRPLGEMLKKDFPQIKNMCRVEDHNVVVKYGDNVFHERVRYTDPSFLSMFTFPLKWGTPASLADVNSIIISEKMSIKYFGKLNPVGEMLLVKFEGSKSKSFVVSGVAADFPKARTIDFNFLVNFENVKAFDPQYDFSDWKEFVNGTLIQVNKPSDIYSIQKGTEKYKKIQNDAVPADWAVSQFGFEPLATLAQKAGDIRNHFNSNFSDNYKSVIFLYVIGAFMLALACFNYINLAIVSAAKRLKEIGIRKSIGATRSSIAVQFLGENIITTFIALVLGFLFAIFAVIPWFEQINHFNMDFTLADARLWIYLPLILLFTGILSGLYPALYISKFRVVGILKGAIKIGKKNPLTKALLVFQFILACILVTSAVVFTENTSYLAKRPWGYNQHSVLYTPVPDGPGFEKLKALMIRDPGVVSVSGSSEHLGKSSSPEIVHLPDRQYEVERVSVEGNYFETMGLTVTQGRGFKDSYETDKRSIVINELFAKGIGEKNPIGLAVVIDSMQYRVIGVVKDFHSRSFFNKIKPVIFQVADQEHYKYVSMKVLPDAEDRTYKRLQANWTKLYPEIPFDGGYQEDIWGGYYEEIGTHATVWKIIAVIAVLLTSLGLYGLVKLNVAGRIKEFSVRKVLGAGLPAIANAIVRQYIPLMSIALIIGAPVSYFLMKRLMDFTYSYHIPLTVWVVVTSLAILITVILLTVSTQISSVMKAKAVNGLKSD